MRVKGLLWKACFYCNILVKSMSEYKCNFLSERVWQHGFQVLLKYPKFNLRLKFQTPMGICCVNMPQVLKYLYPRTWCIIDCSEIFIECPCSYQARAQRYSNYKKHNTVLFLIGFTPCGAISYLSKCWGGRATDKCITMNSDFLSLLEYGDVVLADRGFEVADNIAIHGATLIIPLFMRGKKQLSLEDVEKSQKICKGLHTH